MKEPAAHPTTSTSPDDKSTAQVKRPKHPPAHGEDASNPAGESESSTEDVLDSDSPVLEEVEDSLVRPENS